MLYNYSVLEVERKVIAEAGLAGMSGVWEGATKKLLRGVLLKRC